MKEENRENNNSKITDNLTKIGAIRTSVLKNTHKNNMKINKQKGEGWFIGLIVVGLIIWGVIFLFSRSNKSDDYDSGRTSVFSGSRDCSSLMPSNPYSGGSGHYAGFEWGERGNTCGGNSNSFIEGCEEYENQEKIYNNCLSR